MHVRLNIEARLCDHCCSGKAISNTHSQCVSVALVIQHAVRILRIIVTSVACLTLPYFSTLSHKRQDFLKKKLLNIKCTFWFPLQLLSETFLILGLHLKWPLFSSDLNETLIFSADFRNILKYKISWKSVQREQSCPMRTKRRTVRHDEVNCRFSQFRECA